jgi:hypothetical protein
VEVEADQARGARRGADCLRAPERPADGPGNAEPPVQVRTGHQLGFGGERFPGQRLGEPHRLRPRVASDHERMARDCARVAYLWIPLAAVEDRAAPDERERFVLERLRRDPRARHSGHPVPDTATTAMAR